MAKRRTRACAKCGSSEVKLFPDEFGSSKWPLIYIPMGAKLAGGPDPSRPILVCTDCGHNEDVTRRDL